MNEQQKQGVSALLDGEGGKRETDELLVRLDTDPDLAATLARYSLIGQTLRGEPIHHQALDIHRRVSEQLADEPAVLAPARHAANDALERWWRPVAGVAIAASVAALAVVFTPSLLQAPASPVVPGIAASGSDSLAATPVNMTVSEGTRWTDGQPAVEDRLNSYLADHSEFAVQGGAPSLIPYASFVSYDGDR